MEKNFGKEAAGIIEAATALVAAIAADSDEMAHLLGRVDVRVSLASRERLILISVLHPTSGDAVPIIAVSADPRQADEFGRAGLPVAVAGLHTSVAPELAN